VLSPLDVIALESLFECFCPVDREGGVYHEDIFRLNGCEVCATLLLQKGGTA
jgi:hypothetical protein